MSFNNPNAAELKVRIEGQNENIGEPIYFMTISITESQSRGTPHKHSMILDEMS